MFELNECNSLNALPNVTHTNSSTQCNHILNYIYIIRMMRSRHTHTYTSKDIKNERKKKNKNLPLQLLRPNIERTLYHSTTVYVYISYSFWPNICLHTEETWRTVHHIYIYRYNNIHWICVYTYSIFRLSIRFHNVMAFFFSSFLLCSVFFFFLSNISCMSHITHIY